MLDSLSLELKTAFIASAVEMVVVNVVVDGIMSVFVVCG